MSKVASYEVYGIVFESDRHDAECIFQIVSSHDENLECDMDAETITAMERSGAYYVELERRAKAELQEGSLCYCEHTYEVRTDEDFAEEPAPVAAERLVVTPVERPTEQLRAGIVVEGDVIALTAPKRAAQVLDVESLDERRVRWMVRDLATNKVVPVTRLRDKLVPIYRQA